MENVVEEKYSNEKFIVCLEDGSNKVATPITRLKIDGTDTEYYYYSIDDEMDKEKVSILASRIVTDTEGNESLKDLENEEERQIAYQLFAQTYKILKNKKKEENNPVTESEQVA